MLKQKSTGQGVLSETSSFIRFLVLLILAAILMRVFVVQAYTIPSASMEDTLLVGDFIIANKLAYGAPVPFMEATLPGYKAPENGDVVIFRFPHDNEREFIKRCVALPGQTVEIKDKVLYVDGERTIDPKHSKYIDARVLAKESKNGVRDNYGPVTVPPDHYFLIGDNRDNSDDSRFWGFVPRHLIVAKASFIYFSWAPDADAPSYKGLTSLPGVLVYNGLHFFSRVRFSRLAGFVN
ncbi:MAG: signal peptidase I [Gemmatimonadetes bacterium]|jgi:signal peptidase I|nr:signal peptidase I [Gemmatimonadota bacterium]